MRATKKLYLENIAKRKSLHRTIEDTRISQDYEKHFEARKQIEELNSEYFNKLTKTPVTYHLGGRRYFEEVVKIGKYFYNDRGLMSKSRYRAIIVIDEITEEMRKEMISDSHFY